MVVADAFPGRLPLLLRTDCCASRLLVQQESNRWQVDWPYAVLVRRLPRPRQHPGVHLDLGQGLRRFDAHLSGARHTRSTVHRAIPVVGAEDLRRGSLPADHHSRRHDGRDAAGLLRRNCPVVQRDPGGQLDRRPREVGVVTRGVQHLVRLGCRTSPTCQP